MATVDLTMADFQSTVVNNDIVFVDVWANWCGPCRMFGPVFKAASDNHPDVVFGKVDTVKSSDLAQALQIQSIPTIMAFRQGKLVYREAGALRANQFEELIQAVKNLDMDALQEEAE